MVSTDILFDHGGQLPLNKRKSIASRFNGPLYIRLFRPTPAVRKWIDQRLHDWGISAFDLGRGFLIVQKEATDESHPKDITAVSVNTGMSTRPHLHLTTKKDGKVIDPTIFLDYIRKCRGITL